MRSALAICWRISAEGRRSPRSIWLRYGLEIPASSESRRSESRAVPRCSRMKEPRSNQRSLGSVLTLASVPPQRHGPELPVVPREPRDPGGMPVESRVGISPPSGMVQHTGAQRPARRPPRRCALAEYTLPDLPYDYAALEPYVSAQIMELHHDKHHAAYVAGANQTLEKLAAARDKDDFGAIVGLQKTLAFHVAGHVLHSIFWKNQNPDGGDKPDGALGSAIGE